jgi:hypothetical protein
MLTDACLTALRASPGAAKRYAAQRRAPGKKGSGP